MAEKLTGISAANVRHRKQTSAWNCKYRVGQKSKPGYFCNNFVYC